MLAPFITPLIYLLIVAGAYGWGYVHSKYKVEARMEQVCNDRIASLKQEHDDESKRLADEAKRARDEVEPTPDDLAELRRLCANDPACRDRNQN